jgi:peptidoglycan DL-endopeptidase CwlO
VDDLDILRRAHDLFAGHSARLELSGAVPFGDSALSRATGGAAERYRAASAGARDALRTSAGTDAELAGVIERAQHEHRQARDLTGRILQEARADAATPVASPLAEREAMRRRAARLRSQHRVVADTHRSAAKRAAQLRLLRYAAARLRARRRGLPPASGRAAEAVRAALSRLGRPYVWGATGPDRFDCSGLVQWAYRHAGIDLLRTTYDQIHQGVAVSRAQVQPGDLVFPHTGHVQMAIGNGMVVEAPHAGANVRVGRMGDVIAIRRVG